MNAEKNHALNLSILRADRRRTAWSIKDNVPQYIANVALELRNVAKSAELKTLQGLLEIAYYEAFQLAHPSSPTQDETEYLSDLEKAARKAEDKPAIRSRRQR